MNDQHDAAAPGKPELRFDSDRGSSRPFWLALILLLAIVAWMGSGYVFPSEPPAQETVATENAPPSVRVRSSTAEAVVLEFRSEGQAMPDRDTRILAEGAGEIVEMPVAKGRMVERGDVIAQLDDRRARSTLDQAIEQRANAEREFNNATELFNRGTATQTRVSETRAALAAAQASVVAAEQELADLTITAPFEGLIEALPVSAGEYVSVGEQIARIVDNSPLTVTIQVPQQTHSRLQVGQAAKVNFITGQEREGTVSFVGTAAQAETRTFLTEIEVPNEDRMIPAGVSAMVTIPTGEAQAHFIHTSIISLSPDGHLGVKTVEDRHVRFQRIGIVKTEVDGIWVSGLEDEATIITIGQGFVRDSEEVRAQTEEEAGQPEDTAAQSDAVAQSDTVDASEGAPATPDADTPGTAMQERAQ
ncbi:efflux RND transporter periplasmic adaptor subunit [Roseicitreum antarcticum]|uniref:Membrane fusion protein, multidrug efflux system n=1 Tax=Roseicitreum antarcticum TaxID=564137 RepID=A0A1H2TPG8_9RHOB|nr:efflux RND transporter periplasmic adaptor subunit [Roseicitreum antarcticum]SDW45667.1 membrane fusion protein, multidrug efflux system [Roseicitreum antarcticum]